jgi:alpha-beta hydrolase superfamily lysophospholipase
MADLLDHPLISDRYFFPRAGSFTDPFWVDCDGARLACSYHELDPKAKTLVHFHGNGEIVDDWQGDFVKLVQQMGCNCFLAELRGYGQSSGEPQLGQMLKDVVPTINSLGRSEEDLIFFGRSVGSIFALEAVVRFPQAAGLILESGVADVLERLLHRVDPSELGVCDNEFRQEIEGQLDHQAKLASYPGPVLVLHTEHDGLVDVSHGQRLYDWSVGKKSIKIFAQGDHNSIMFENAREYFALVDRFINELK